MSAEITVYSFESADGTPDSYTTMDPVEAKARGEKYSMRVVANTYEWQEDETAWDFTGVDDLLIADDLPLCVLATGCYCAGHARGNPADEPCDTSETSEAGEAGEVQS